ncbi:hypothetical protein JTB14_019518 [Gonioctena quinquepunctata]|nr:hypothetical protein JTB14_019518 [Gonioctena quinquepunctata]
MEFTDEDMKEAKTFGEFYVDKLENHKNLFKYYLAENVVLDWFGQTIRGEKKVNDFLKKTLASVNHLFSDALPAKEIGFRDTHIIKVPKEPKLIPIGLMSPPRTFHLKTQAKTPKKQSIPSTSRNRSQERPPPPQPREQGQGDGFHRDECPTSPAKKMKTSALGDFADADSETVEGEYDSVSTTTQKLKYAVSEGAIEFHKPSLKKLQVETKWRRPCKLSVAYAATNCTDYTMYLIIYEGNNKCRRNLMREFEAEEQEN